MAGVGDCPHKQVSLPNSPPLHGTHPPSDTGRADLALSWGVAHHLLLVSSLRGRAATLTSLGSSQSPRSLCTAQLQDSVTVSPCLLRVDPRRAFKVSFLSLFSCPLHPAFWISLRHIRGHSLAFVSPVASTSILELKRLRSHQDSSAHRLRLTLWPDLLQFALPVSNLLLLSKVSEAIRDYSLYVGHCSITCALQEIIFMAGGDRRRQQYRYS